MNRSFLRFVFVGIAGFIVDSGLTMVIAHFHVSYIHARIPAIAVAMLTTWLLNRRFTFDVRNKKTMSEVARYAAVSLVSAFLNFLLYSLMVTAGFWPPLAVAIATGSLMVFSFLAYRRVAFRKHEEKHI